MRCNSVVVDYFPPHPFDRGVVLGLGENNEMEKFLKSIGIKINIKKLNVDTKKSTTHLMSYTPTGDSLVYTEIKDYDSEERKLSKYCSFIGETFIRFLENKITKSDNDIQILTDFMDKSVNQIIKADNYKSHDYNFMRYPELYITLLVINSLSSIKNKQINVDVNKDTILISVFIFHEKSYDKWKKLGIQVIKKLNKNYPLMTKRTRLLAAKAISVIYHNDLEDVILYFKFNRNIFWKNYYP